MALSGDDWKDEYPEYSDIFEEEHPIAKLYRREHEEQLMKLNVINKLLDSLRSADGRIPLFSFAEIRAWGLRKNARRAVEPPVDDGA